MGSDESQPLDNSLINFEDNNMIKGFIGSDFDVIPIQGIADNQGYGGSDFDVISIQGAVSEASSSQSNSASGSSDSTGSGNSTGSDEN